MIGFERTNKLNAHVDYSVALSGFTNALLETVADGLKLGIDMNLETKLRGNGGNERE